MRNIAEYIEGSFIDFKGETHNVIVCALSSSPDFVCFEVNDGDCGEFPEEFPVERALSLGYSICNPEDEFDIDLGRNIARNRAEMSVPKLVALERGIINTKLVDTFLKQELDFIINNPSKFIKGYDKQEQEYFENLKFQDEISKISKDEKTFIDIIIRGINVDKCIKLAKKLIK